MFLISKDSPVYYLTSVTNARLPVFRTSRLRDLPCEAVDEAVPAPGYRKPFLAYNSAVLERS